MHPTKYLLICKHGSRCMCCGEEKPLKELQWHHIKPKYVSKANHEEPDDSYENGSILCLRCHIDIHRYLWWDDEFQLLTEIILRNKNEPTSL